MLESFDGNADYLQGCAWSSAYGWVCFNGGSGAQYQCNTQSNPACAALSTNGVAITPFATAGKTWFYQLSSPAYQGGGLWDTNITATQRASILSLWQQASPMTSYIGFPSDPLDTPSSTDDGLLYGCFGCGLKCSLNKNKSCTTDQNCGATEGSCKRMCDACLNVSTEPEKPAGNAQANPNPNLLCWDCGNNGKECTIGDTGGSCIANKDKNTCMYSSCAACTNYTGVVINQPKANQYEMCGWGYHSYRENNTVKGLGWLAFNSEKKLGDTTFIDVKEGSIFSGGNIYSPSGPPLGKYNAAYVIEASGDITNWYSQNAYRFAQGSNLPTFLQDTENSGIFSNVLGRLDYKGLVTDVTKGRSLQSGESGTNKYGSVLQYQAAGSVNWGAKIFNDTVYYTPGNLTVQSLTIGKGQGATPSGAGIAVVEGNLTITGNISYEANPTISNLKQTPSMVWIVKGDVIIDPSVTGVAGTFIVLGNATRACPTLASGVASNGCGRFSTGSGASQLAINGAVLARQFNFQRTFSSNLLPSEEFQPDGRLQANPPKGLSDFVKSVPRFSFGS